MQQVYDSPNLKPFELQAPVLPLVLKQYTCLATKRTRSYFVEKLDLSPSGTPGFNATETAV